MFSVLLTIISSLIAYLELSIALVHMNIVRQRIRNNFRQSLMSKDTRKATLQAETLLDSTWQNECVAGQLCERSCSR